MLKWSEKYTVGFKVIDEQHQKFFLVFNKLYEAFLRGDAESQLADSLRELVKYSEEHFATEEEYFHQFNYSKIDEHIMEHNVFRNQIEHFQKTFNQSFGRKELADDLVELLDFWFAKHVIEMDHQYIECFREHGLK